MDVVRNSLFDIELEIAEKVGSGMSKRDAVYAVKSELAKISKPLEATGHYKDAIAEAQKRYGCSLDDALVKLKLMVRSRYADESVWN